jgi:4-hydroxy-2-oxoheptanedioate aldolase
VRVPGVAEADILKALDIGAHGVQVPNVDSKEAAARAASYAKYPPAGRRGFSPFTRAGNYSAQNARELARSANGNTLLAMHIEGPEAIENVEEILQTDALDVLFIGLYDISKSLGRAGDVDHADVLHAAERLVKAADKAGKCPGTIVTNAAQLNRFLGMGVRYITYSVDCDMLGRAYKQALSEFKEPALSRASKS